MRAAPTGGTLSTNDLLDVPQTAAMDGNGVGEGSTKTVTKTEAFWSKHLQGKEKEFLNLAHRQEPLNLLDLPLDILQAIFKEITHTNDLTSLALTHSALHEVVIPHIYSRFDIVWPEANITTETRAGVDALTYGLATLVMANDVFGETPRQLSQERECPTHEVGGQPRIPKQRRIRRGNHFAQFTRKFSLGNGPPDWVSEYLINKEGGKMLGTLAALAVGRMRNLETFIWDMPTGVLRDVWLALASLAERDDRRPCRLERVWVRWHDSREVSPLGATPHPVASALHRASLPFLLGASSPSLFHIPAYPSVVFPTFSVLPPLRSLSVLDIDEVPYVEEMSVLIERSLDQLKELRVGVALHARREVPFRPVEDRSIVPPPATMNDEPARPSGLLWILVRRFCTTLGSRVNPSGAGTGATIPNGLQNHQAMEAKFLGAPQEMEAESSVNDLGAGQLSDLVARYSLEDETTGPANPATTASHNPTPEESDPSLAPSHQPGGVQSFQHKPPNGSRRMRLEILELEGVHLTTYVLSRSIDWSRLTTLTILGCMNHEQLWKNLRKAFTPASTRHRSSSHVKVDSVSSRTRAATSSAGAADRSDFKLSIRRLHTDTVSNALLAFVRDALAPDTIEWLFLQETPHYKSAVTVDQIYRTVIRRHRGSLRKLLLNSGVRRGVVGGGIDPEREREPADTSWRRWVCNRELLTCITAGKMQLRELSVAIDYKDWHYFLQRLPGAPTLRSLHVLNIAEHPYDRANEPREVALQVLDIISLRPEIELCYLGIESKCFEIVEFNSSRAADASPTLNAHDGIDITTHTQINNDDEDEEEDDDDDDPHHGLNAQGHSGAGLDDDDDGDSWDASDFGGNDDGHVNDDDDADDDAESVRPPKPAFRLREILFYDDKITIFKARHGRL